MLRGAKSMCIPLIRVSGFVYRQESLKCTDAMWMKSNKEHKGHT